MKRAPRPLWPLALCAGLLVLGGCATPPLVEQDAAERAVDQARFLGAPEVDPEDWELALKSLKEGEKRVRKGDYDRAIAAFSRAEFFAGKTILSVYEQSEEAAEAPEPETPGDAAIASPPPSPPAPRLPAPSPAPLLSYTVKPGETLWTIAARKRVYGDALLWPLIYKANRDQIKDPRQIYPNQVLTIPRGFSDQEREAAREQGRRSDVFSLPVAAPGAGTTIVPVR